jgi:hypothetical protein
MNFPGINETVPVQDLMRLNDMLRKSGDVGYQTPASISGAGSLSALVPQSLEASLASATFTMNEIALWKNIPKVKVGSTVHEYNVIKEHGLDLSPYMAEGGIPAMNKTEYERKFLKVKYLSEMRQITDVASTINPLVGPNPTALAEETERGTIRLMSKLERELWHGDEDANALGFDGVIKQISAEPKSVVDMRGASLTAARLQETLSDVYAAPFYGSPDCIYVEPRVHGDLINSTVQFGRHDQLKVSDGSSFTFGAQQLNIMAPYGSVPVKAAPFLFNSWDAPAAASGHGLAAATVKSIANPVDAASLFVAADAGEYWYKIVPVSNSAGYGAAVQTAKATIVAGKSTVITMHAHATADFFRVYRSPVGSQAGKHQFIGQMSNSNPGTSEDVFTDINAVIPGTSSVVMIKHDPNYLQVVRLLDYLRRPLAEVQTTRPFLLMMFLSCVVKIPSKMRVLKNVGIA